jgi:hypothetical protein
MGAAAIALAGCAYDYVQRTDRVSYSAGDAVHANLEMQTANPSKKSMRVTTGLGRNGYVAPNPGTAAPSSSVVSN